MEEVKVNIKNTSEEVKKTPKRTAKKEAPVEKSSEKRDKDGKIITLIVSILVTAVVVGGGFYAWQKNSMTAGFEKIKEEARIARMDLESRMSGIKDKLSGVEKENEDLKIKNGELQEKAELLSGAIREFNNTEIGISFFYPALFGEGKAVIENKEKGKTFQVNFLKNDKLFFVGVSKDYPGSGTSSSVELSNISSFSKKDDKYFLVVPGFGAEDYQVNPIEIIKTGKGEALLLDNKSFVIKEGVQGINVGENLIVVVNLNNENFGGAVFVDSDFGAVSVDDFKKIVQSIK